MTPPQRKIAKVVFVLVLFGVLWYFVSPFFLSRTVDEAFPGAVSSITEEANEKQTGEVEEQEAVQRSEEESLSETEREEIVSEGPQLVKEGVFVGADSFHQGSGRAGVYALSSGEHVLRFENFSVTNGPDLRVLLAVHPQPRGGDDLGDGEYVELGKLKGDRGNQNYTLPAGIDLNEYKSVVIYCKPFSVVFATAEIE